MLARRGFGMATTSWPAAPAISPRRPLAVGPGRPGGAIPGRRGNRSRGPAPCRQRHPGTERRAPLPDLPTAAEAGFPGVLLTTWTGYYAPKGTPRQIVQRINADSRTVAAVPEAKMASGGPS